ncbi:type 1 glutamine amidotransferase domain-containing protein [Weeksella virosa]|uniref:type 1 glutamine amidotransferase domain-containing protein n=1 Tax=Weeksella virosa TaxID=1014 RepID=UPI0025525525|nr:type 1 glutamine amidotransferase domain-containing protein [Weeksella virosa]MDK7374972.1 type 1 glutamine amidotransferase domain-containing protein [Weeksella virosa]
MNKRIAILTEEGFEEVELSSPKKVLEDAGFKVDIISTTLEPIKSWDHTDWGKTYEVNRNVDQEKINISCYDALILPGGVLNPDKLRLNENALQLIRDFNDAGKPVAAICHAPQVLIDAGVVKGKKLTSYLSVRKDLENAGALWLDQSVVIDGNLITSRTPNDLSNFNRAILEALKK